MITGEGLTPLNLQLQPNQRGLQGQLLSSVNKLINNPESQNRLLDLVDLSEEARAQLQNDRKAIGTLIKGRGALEDQKIDQLREQLGQIREQIDFIGNLLPQAGGEQRQTLLRAAEEAGKGLEQIGRQLGFIDDSESSVEVNAGSTSITAVSLTASFNSVATIETAEGDVAQFRQSIDIELSFLSISTAQSSINVEANERSAELARTAQQFSLIQAQASVNSEQSISIQSTEGGSRFPAEPGSTALRDASDPISSLLREFVQTAKDFRSLVEEFQNNLSDENRIPPSIINVIKKLVGKVLSGEDGNLFKQSV